MENLNIKIRKGGRRGMVGWDINNRHSLPFPVPVFFLLSHFIQMLFLWPCNHQTYYVMSLPCYFFHYILLIYAKQSNPMQRNSTTLFFNLVAHWKWPSQKRPKENSTESHGYEIEGGCLCHLTLFSPFRCNDIFKGTTACFLYEHKIAVITRRAIKQGFN